MVTGNEIWINTGRILERLDLDESIMLLPSLQASDRTKPESIQSDFSVEFSVPSTVHNHRLLKHAASSQSITAAGYKRVPCVLTSGGVETLPLVLLYLKGYSEGLYNLQPA